MKIFAVRHGQSEYNVKELCDSDPSVKTPLTELGRIRYKASRRGRFKA